MTDLELDDATLGQMLRIAAHDLRNPLAVIISNLGYLRAVLEGAESEILETLLDTVTSCDDLKHVISNIELLGSTLRNVVPDVTSGFELLACTQEVVAQCEGLAKSHDVDFERDLVQGEAAWAAGSGALYERALSNLVRNAIRHTPAGSVVRLELEVDSKRCCARVLDSGPAIDSATAFSARGQIEAKSTGIGRYGRGLGLLVARISTAEMDATLDVRPARGEFTSVVELRMDRSSSRPPDPPDAQG
jgi:signal transduction histidine kinase